MKKVIWAISLVSAGMAQPLFAMVPVTMSGPIPAIASVYNAGASGTFVYTITNNVPHASFPITVSGLSGPISRATVSNDCGSRLPAGPSTCNIGITIAPSSQNAGSTINQTLSVNYQGRDPLLGPISFSVPAADSVFTAVGENFSNDTPLLTVSTGGLTNWLAKSYTEALGVPTQGSLSGSSCTGSGSTAICTAVGINSDTSKPLLIVSTDGGNTWTQNASFGTADSGQFFASSCTGSGSTAICIASGEDSDLGNPLLVMSQDGGVTWTKPDVVDLPDNGAYSGTSCTGSGSSAVCIATGTPPLGLSTVPTSPGTPPFVAVSRDGGATWVNTTFSDEAQGVLYGASCVGSGATALCTLAGQSAGPSLKNKVGIPSIVPLLYVSHDGGASWEKITTFNTLTGFFKATSCTGTGSTAICTAAGINIGLNTPMLAVSTDGGTTWSLKSASSIQAKSHHHGPFGTIANAYQGTSCTGTGSTAVCIAAGRDFPGSNPLLSVSTDGGATWGAASVPNLDLINNGLFNATSCTGSGPTAMCTAVGENTGDGDLPILVESFDGGKTWSMTSITGVTDTTGTFNAAAASGGN